MLFKLPVRQPRYIITACLLVRCHILIVQVDFLYGVLPVHILHLEKMSVGIGLKNITCYLTLTGWYWNVYTCHIHTHPGYWIYVLNNDPSAWSLYHVLHIKYCATTYVSHSYHSNPKMLCFKKIVHSTTVKPQLGQSFNRWPRGHN